jgi:hypothetical protein
LITFQWIMLPLLGLLLVFSLLKLRRAGHRRAAFTSALIWLLAAIAVARPELTIRVAKGLGIGRGTDLVLYLFAIAYLLTAFYFYNKTSRIETAVTKIVRHLAISQTNHDTPQRKPATQVEPK